MLLLEELQIYILKEDEKLVRIFLYAPLEYRLNKVMEIYHDSHEDALRYIHKSDHSRKSYYEVISNKIWGDKSNYDLCINTASAENQGNYSRYNKIYCFTKMILSALFLNIAMMYFCRLIIIFALYYLLDLLIFEYVKK